MTDNNPYVRKWRAKGWLPALPFECSDCNAGEPGQCMKASHCSHRDGEYVRGEALARCFHETYERLAPSFGYETRAATREFDPATPNGKLMIAVCAALAPSTQSDSVEARTIERCAAVMDERAAMRARLYEENGAAINAHKAVEAEDGAAAIRALPIGGGR